MTENSKLLAQIEAQRKKQAETTPSTQPKKPSTPIIDSPVVRLDAKNDGAKDELRRLDLATVYRNWFHPKSEYSSGNEVNLSCFNTDFHKGGDVNPQFGINTTLNTYYCHACNVRGDIIDLAAVRFGLADSDYRCPQERVHEAVKLAGEELCGMAFVHRGGAWYRVPDAQPIATPAATAAPAHPAPPPDRIAAQPTPPPTGTAAQPTPPPAPVAAPVAAGVEVNGIQVVRLHAQRAAVQPQAPAVLPPIRQQDEVVEYVEDDEADEPPPVIELNWREILPAGSIGYKYMEVVTKDDVPEEYHFWTVLSLMSVICGRDVCLWEASPVYSNIFTCMIGRTGAGKSQADGRAYDLAAMAVPHQEGNEMNRGVKIISSPGSGEDLSKHFQHRIPSPVPAPQPGQKGQPKVIVPDIEVDSVRGLVKYGEMQKIVAKMRSQSSSLESILLELYDTSRAPMGGSSLTGGSTKAMNYFGCLTTTTQLDMARRLLTSDQIDSGFLNRWIFVIGKEKPRISRPHPIPMDSLIGDMRQLSEWARGIALHHGGRIEFDESTGGSGEIFDAFNLDIAQPLEKTAPIYARSSLLYKKLTLILAINSKEQVISKDTVLAAQQLWKYVTDCLRVVEGRILGNDSSELNDRVFNWIKDQQDTSSMGLPLGPNMKNILRRFDNRFGLDAYRIKQIIANMRDVGMLMELNDGRMDVSRKKGIMYIVTEEWRD